MLLPWLPADRLIRLGYCWVFLAATASVCYGAVGFEKLTDMDYRGSTYYTIRNLTLYECQGWCREEPECQAASFSFVPNLSGSGQETVCLLQNGTTANNPAAQPSKAISTYYMVKLRIRSEQVCERPWTFERLPNHMIRGLDNALIFTSTKEACLAACLNEDRFVCRSAEYNYVTLQCHMSEHDRRSVSQPINLVQVQGVDYFENLCLSGKDACKGERGFPAPKLGIPNDLINRYVETHFYVDLELMANNAEACRRACEIESEILCRSYVYRGPPTGKSYNCQLFHMDHVSIPDGKEAFLAKDRPLYDTQVRPGTYYENVCRSTRSASLDELPTTAPGLVIPPSYDPSKLSSGLVGKEPQEILPPSAFGSFDLGTGLGVNRPNAGLTGTQDSNKFSDIRPPSIGSTDNSNKPAETDDASCDSTGTCYDVSVQCKDTRIVVQLATNKPFNGRVYALGRSETCNVDVFNSDRFRLDLTLSGQDCNTQSIGTVYSNTVVVQHHSVVMTKTDKIYKVRCTYDMSSKNITFGMLPIRDPEMISITSAPAAPSPRIRILDQSGQEVETVRIGDRLTFRIEIPNNTPYGIFARNCVAMAKDARSTFNIVDSVGCPSDPAIFPQFKSYVSSLESQYEAFRFTESYGVIFQCNVKYCLGECEPAQCSYNGNQFQSWGRRKRSIIPDTISSTDRSVPTDLDPESMTLSQEILVLDFGDEPFHHTDRRTSQPQVDVPSYSTQDSAEFAADQSEHFGEKTRLLEERCPTKTSVLALSVACAIMVISYLCCIFYMLMKRWMRRNNKAL